MAGDLEQPFTFDFQVLLSLFILSHCLTSCRISVSFLNLNPKFSYAH